MFGCSHNLFFAGAKKPLHTELLQMVIEVAVIEQGVFLGREFSKERMRKRGDGISFR